MSVHPLRHTFTLHHLRRHPSKLSELADVLRHESLDTTAMYSKPSRDDLAADPERISLKLFDGSAPQCRCPPACGATSYGLDAAPVAIGTQDRTMTPYLSAISRLARSGYTITVMGAHGLICAHRVSISRPTRRTRHPPYPASTHPLITPAVCLDLLIMIKNRR